MSFSSFGGLSVRAEHIEMLLFLLYILLVRAYVNKRYLERKAIAYYMYAIVFNCVVSACTDRRFAELFLFFTHSMRLIIVYIHHYVWYKYM